MTGRAATAAKLAAICDVLGISAAEALEMLAEAREAPAAPRTPSSTVAEFLPLVEAATKPGARRTYATYWRRLVDAYGDRPLSEVRTSDLERLRVSLPESEAVVRRANWREGYQAQRSAVQAWRKFFAVAVADKLVTDNPASRCPMERRRPSARRGLTRDEVVALYDVVAGGGDDPELDCLIVRTCLETGARRDGLVTLTLGSVNPARQTLLLHEKGNQSRELPITPTLAKALLSHAADRGATATEDPLLRYRSGRPLSRRRFNTLFARVQAAAPFPDAASVSAHWLRHTAVTWVERAGGEATAAAFAGHAPAQSRVTGLYTTAATVEVVRAWHQVWQEPHPLLPETQAQARGLPSPPTPRPADEDVPGLGTPPSHQRGGRESPRPERNEQLGSRRPAAQA